MRWYEVVFVGSDPHRFRLRPERLDGPEVPGAVAVGGEEQFPTVRRPSRDPVPRRIGGQANALSARGRFDPDVVVAAVHDAAGDPLAVGRPVRVERVFSGTRGEFADGDTGQENRGSLVIRSTGRGLGAPCRSRRDEGPGEQKHDDRGRSPEPVAPAGRSVFKPPRESAAAHSALPRSDLLPCEPAPNRTKPAGAARNPRSTIPPSPSGWPSRVKRPHGRSIPGKGCDGQRPTPLLPG